MTALGQRLTYSLQRPLSLVLDHLYLVLIQNPVGFSWPVPAAVVQENLLREGSTNGFRMSEAPVYNSYMEAYMAGGKGGSPAPGYAGSRASTEQYSYGPKGSAERVRKSRNFVDCGSPLVRVVVTGGVGNRVLSPIGGGTCQVLEPHGRVTGAILCPRGARGAILDGVHDITFTNIVHMGLY